MSERVKPKVFISYSWESEEHKARVRVLVDRLRSDGFTCIFDQYDRWPAGTLENWMDRGIKGADFVLVICSERYHHSVTDLQSRDGAPVAWEFSGIKKYLFDTKEQTKKIIPVLLEDGKQEDIPNRLTQYVLSEVDTTTFVGYADLCQRLMYPPKAVGISEALQFQRPAPVLPVLQSPSLGELREILAQEFGYEELQDLVSDLANLRIPRFEDLGETQAAKARAIMDHCRRHGCISALSTYIQRKRPHLFPKR